MCSLELDRRWWCIPVSVCVCVNVKSRNSFRLYINTYVHCRVPRSLLMYWGRTRLLHRLRSYYGDCGLLCVCYERLNVLLWRHGLGIDMMILLKEKVEDKNNALENIYILCAYGRRRGGVVGGGGAGGWTYDGARLCCSWEPIALLLVRCECVYVPLAFVHVGLCRNAIFLRSSLRPGRHMATPFLGTNSSAGFRYQ